MINAVKNLTVVVMVVSLIVLLLVGLKACGVVDKATNTDRIIYNYEWFHSSYNDIQGIEQQIKNKEELLNVMKADSNTDQMDLKKVEIELSGLKNMRVNFISEYNAKASQVNRSIWKSGSLPDHINY